MGQDAEDKVRKHAYFDLNDRVIRVLDSRPRVSRKPGSNKPAYSGIGSVSTRISKEGGCHLTAFIADELDVINIDVYVGGLKEKSDLNSSQSKRACGSNRVTS
jgi:hypothetical protein